MRKGILNLLTATTVLSLSGTALADIESVKELDDGKMITLEGTVDGVNSEREFILRDASGTIKVDIDSTQSVVLTKGQKVSVTGVLDKDLLTGSDINAREVVVHKDAVGILEDAIEGHTDISLQGATTYQIGDLPENGHVKVHGKILDVDSEKEFTLEDSTGKIDVELRSAENAVVTEGAQVTVVGDLADSGERIDANRVWVSSNAQSVDN